MTDAPPRRQRLFGCILVALALLAAAGLAEVFLRVFAPVEYCRPQERRADAWRSLAHRASTLPGLTYELAPDVDTDTGRGSVHTNHFGMRDRERRLDADVGTLRVAVLGDSFTFGFGVTAEEAYPAVLERLLNEHLGLPEKHFEVLNFGVGGYSTRDEAALLEHKVRPFHPGVVVVGYVLNDPEIDPIQPLHAYFTRSAWWQHSHLLRRLAEAANARAVARYGQGNYTRYLHREPRKWASVLAGFERIHQLEATDGFRVLVAIFPMIPAERWQSYPYRDLHQQVAAAARAEGFAVLDLEPVLATVPPAELWVSRDDRHPNARGHALAAEAIYDKIRDLNWNSGVGQPGMDQGAQP